MKLVLMVVFGEGKNKVEGLILVMNPGIYQINSTLRNRLKTLLFNLTLMELYSLCII